MTHLSLTPLFRSSIGFDRLSDVFESALRSEATSYPPYNVEKHSADDYRIVVAAAGFSESEIDIQVERNVLTIGSVRKETAGENVQMLHRGIAQRSFKLSFQLDDHIEVKTASLNNGLLQVDLVRRIPEEAKPRRIPIGTSGSQPLQSNTVPMSQAA